MIASHLLLLIVFSLLTSAVFAALLRDDLKSRLSFGLLAFSAFVLSAVVAGWLMSPFPD